MKVINLLFFVLLFNGCGQQVALLIPPKDGVNGTNGSNGHSAAFSSAVPLVGVCSNGGSILNAGVDLNDDTILDLNEITVSVVTCNGVDGVSPALPALMPVAILDPCGDAAGIYDEVFLKLANGTVLASFSDNANGLNTRFSKLIAGTYNTTDGSNCTFSIDANGNLL